MAMRVTARGEYFLFVAHESPPMAVTVLDVTEPEQPRVVWQMPTEHGRVRANSLALSGETLLVAQQVDSPGLKPAGVRLLDTRDPTSPQPIGFFDTSGPQSRGVHLVTCMDDQYAFLASGAPGFTPRNDKDDQVLVIADVSNPNAPQEAGRWWVRGQSAHDSAPALERHPEPFDIGFRLHHALRYPERPDRAYLGYIDAGIVILDTTDVRSPRLVSRLDYHPPAPGFTHTVVPLFERNLLVVTDEAIGDAGADWPKRIWLVDVADETAPAIISHMPDPEDFEELHRTGGRIGAHNVHENEPWPGSRRLVNTVVATWFTAGVRVYDIRDPVEPVEVAMFIPETPPGQRASRINDVFVDDRGFIYAGDRANGGLYVLEYTGPVPLS